MKSTATSTRDYGNRVVTQTATVKNRMFGGTVKKLKTTTERYTPIASGGRVYQGTSTVKSKKVFK
jgi:hypothetical protein